MRAYIGTKAVGPMRLWDLVGMIGMVGSTPVPTEPPNPKAARMTHAQGGIVRVMLALLCLTQIQNTAGQPLDTSSAHSSGLLRWNGLSGIWGLHWVVIAKEIRIRIQRRLYPPMVHSIGPRSPVVPGSASKDRQRSPGVAGSASTDRQRSRRARLRPQIRKGLQACQASLLQIRKGLQACQAPLPQIGKGLQIHKGLQARRARLCFHRLAKVSRRARSKKPFRVYPSVQTKTSRSRVS